MASKLTWGILGTGYIARIFAKDVPSSRHGELGAVASRSLAKGQAFATEFGIPRVYGSYEELVADPGIDAIYISLPNHLHLEWTIRCAEAGKHILCEKPLASNHAEAMVAIEAAREHDVFLMEAFMYRLHPQTARIYELVREGSIGEARFIETAFGGKMGDMYDNIRLQNAAAGGAILDLGTYGVSISRLIAGAATGQPFAEPLEVKAVGHLGERSRVDEWSSASLRFPGDLIASINCGNQIDLDWTMRVWGSAGHMVVPNPWLPGKDLVPGRILLQRDGKEAEEILLPADEPLYAIEVDAVAEHLDARQVPPPGMGWADTLGNMQVLDAWRRELGLVFDNERADALVRPYSRRPAGPRPDNRMTYGRVAGIDQDVSRIVFGSIHLDPDRLPYAFAMLDHFVESGGNAIDTAAIYGFGRSEQALGEWLIRRGVREQLVLIGKGACTTSCTPELVTSELTESLDRMHTDHVDLYLMHRDNPDVPAGEFVDGLNRELRAGRIRAFGGSNWTVERIAEANEYAATHGLVGFAASSPNFSLGQWNEATWADTLTASDPASRRWYERNDVALFAWSSQASGFFTGRFRPEDRDRPDVADIARVWFNAGNFQRLARVRELAGRKGVTPTQIALAFVLCQPINIYALIGPQTIEEMRTSLQALDVTLTPEERRYVNLEDA